MNRNSKRLTKLSLCTLIFTCTACQNNEMQQADEMKGADKKSHAMNKSEMRTVPDDVTLDQQIKDAVMDLASRTGVAADAIIVREARSVNWGSGAVGCPEPGMNYTQAMVPGLLLLLEADGTIYHYHGQQGRSLMFCPSERAEAPAFGQGQEIM